MTTLPALDALSFSLACELERSNEGRAPEGLCEPSSWVACWDFTGMRDGRAGTGSGADTGIGSLWRPNESERPCFLLGASPGSGSSVIVLGLGKVTVPGPAEAGRRAPEWETARYSSMRVRVGDERKDGGDSGDRGENLERSSTDLDHFLPAVARRSPEREPDGDGGMESASCEAERFMGRLSTDLQQDERGSETQRTTHLLLGMSWSSFGYGLGFVGCDILEPFCRLVRASVGEGLERALFERWNHLVGFWNSEPSPSGDAERGTDVDALRPSFGVGRLEGMLGARQRWQQEHRQ